MWRCYCVWWLLLLTIGTITARKCGQPSQLDGYVSIIGSAPYNPGEEAEIFCNLSPVRYIFEGYHSNVTYVTIRCLNNGTWSWRPPCIANRTCATPPPIPNGAYSIQGRGPRAKATFRCNDGYFLAGPRNGSLSRQEFYRTCRNSLTWSLRPPVKCLARDDCHSVPPPIQHGRRTGPCCSHNDVITYTCNQGYTLIGNATTACHHGRWSGTTSPECLDASTCPRIGIRPTIGTVVRQVRDGQRNKIGDVIHIDCQPGYYFDKEVKVEEAVSDDYNYISEITTVTYDATTRVLRCGDDGQWNGTLPTCQAFTCEPPEIPAKKGHWEPAVSSVKHDETIYLVCNPGYVAVGRPPIKCNMTLQGWDKSIPKCGVLRCPPAVPPLNGYIFEDSTNERDYGAVVKIHCNEGYTRDGSATRECGRNGHWTGLETTCQKPAGNTSRCPNPVIPFGGEMTRLSSSRQGFNNGDVIKYECSDRKNMMMRGPRNLTCRDGLWDPPVFPSCKVLHSYDDENKLASSFDNFFHKVQKDDVVGPSGRRINLNAPGGIDVYFLIDTSASVEEQEFRKATRFVKMFAKQLDISDRSRGNRIAVATFASNPEQEFGAVNGKTNGFHTNVGHNLKRVELLLDTLSYSKGETNITGALRFFRRFLYATSQIQPDRQKPPPTPYLFLISDGAFNVGGNPVMYAKQLKEQDNIEIFCIKVGNDEANQAEHEKTLIDLSSEKEMNQNLDDQHYFHFQNFTVCEYLISKILKGAVNYSQCGVAGRRTGITNGKIIGGDISQPDAWPWMVSIRQSLANDAPFRQYNHICGGTLLDHEWVLTAAHCFAGETYNNPRRVAVKIGTHNLTTAADDIQILDLRVKAMHIHDKWTVDPVTKQHVSANWADDIALLQLERKIEFSEKIRAICLPEPDVEVKDEFGVVTGWGYPKNKTLTRIQAVGLGPDDMSDDLHQLRIPVVTQQEQPNLCYNRYQDEKILCAGYEEQGKDSCRGDSGGPLMIRKTEGNREYWYEIGVVSNGFGCAQGDHDFYARYTDVRRYLGWIRGIMNPSGR